MNVALSLRGAKVTVVGVGTQGGGVGTVCWLLQQGAEVLVSDRAHPSTLRSTTQRIAQFRTRLRRSGRRAALRLITHYGTEHAKEDITRADLVVMNPAVDRTHPVFSWARHSKIPIRIGDTSLFIERCRAPIIAVTGTRGKTTTASLIGAMLGSVDRRTIVAGNLRISPLDDLARIQRMRGKKPIVVLELSSWQVEGLTDIRKSPHIAILTTISADHFDRYPTLKAYAQAKAIIFRFQKPSDHAIINYDNRYCRQIGNHVTSHRWWVSQRRLPSGRHGAFVDHGQIVIRHKDQEIVILRRCESPLPGTHHNGNILCAVLAAYLAGVPILTIRDVLRRFRGVAGRLECVRFHAGVRYVNDTAATTPDAAVAALHAFHPQSTSIILIAGGTDKNLSYGMFCREILRSCRAVVLLPGTATEKMKKLLRRHPCLREASTMAEALRIARHLARYGDTVLLSPAAASFGLFANAYDRGDQFRALVKRL